MMDFDYMTNNDADRILKIYRDGDRNSHLYNNNLWQYIGMQTDGLIVNDGWYELLCRHKDTGKVRKIIYDDARNMIVCNIHRDLVSNKRYNINDEEFTRWD